MACKEDSRTWRRPGRSSGSRTAPQRTSRRPCCRGRCGAVKSPLDSKPSSNFALQTA
jgi:hypothetical protein